jgi:peptidoglycan lytic transglycosylase
MNKKIGLLSIFLLLMFAVPGVFSQEVRQYGNASWYGNSLNGRKTASGESYDMHDFTGAHRQLPFGTLVKVKNLRNGKEVIVRVNDRGPFVKSRIIDLSRAAAASLGILSMGTARVSIVVISLPEDVDPGSAS